MNERDAYKNTFNINNDLQTYNTYKILRNRVNHEIRKSKFKTFNDDINSKLKFARQYHNALKRHNVVDSKYLNDNFSYDPDLLNDTFSLNNNADVDDDIVSLEISDILKQSLEPNFNFTEVTEQDVIKIVRSLKTNSCDIDSISAFFVKLSIDFSVHAIVYIINNSFKYRTFPTQWKKSLVKPIPKNDNPYCESDYRPSISLVCIW